MPRRPSTGGSPRNRKKATPSEPPISASYEFDTPTESELALQKAGWSPTLLDDLIEFRERHHITPEDIAQKRAEGYAIADVIGLEVSGIHSDVLEASRLRGSFHSLARSEEEMALVRELEATRRENAQLKSGDAIVLPISKSQIVRFAYWCIDHSGWFVAGALGIALLWVAFHKNQAPPQQPSTPVQHIRK